jgi:hypothetical protein
MDNKLPFVAFKLVKESRQVLLEFLRIVTVIKHNRAGRCGDGTKAGLHAWVDASRTVDHR